MILAAVQRNYAYEMQQEVTRTDQRARAVHSPVKKSGLMDRISMFSCIFVCAGVAWFIANTGAKTDALNYQVSHLQTEINQVSATNAALTTQVNRLSDPGRIEAIAQTRLHMKFENPVNISGSASGY